MRTEYISVRFCYASRVRPGKPVFELDARGTVKLFRVTEEGRDTLYVSGTNSPVEVPWSNIASATRAPSAEKAKKGE